MISSRFCDFPVSLTHEMLRCLSSSSINSSMLVNCENSNTLRPSASNSGSISMSSSSLADCLIFWAAGTGTRRGSQQTWRSLSNASKICICDLAKPLLPSASRTVFSVVKRMVSYKSACLSPSSTLEMVSCFSGKSVATSPLARRNIKGVIRRRSWLARSLSPCFSIGVRYKTLKRAWLPKKPGIKKLNRLHNSPRWFSIGVPDKHSRWRVLSSLTIFAAWLLAFLMFCASSSTTRCQAWACQRSRSRCSSEYGAITTSWCAMSAAA